MAGAGGLSRLMYAGYSGTSRLGGVAPDQVIRFLTHRFNVRTEHRPGPWHHVIVCTDDDGRIRLLVDYAFSGTEGKWFYQPRSIRRNQWA
jgi:hypothetical protein